MSWFSALASAASESLTKAAASVAAHANMDALQREFGADKSKAALEDLGVTYLTPRLMAMGFPSSPTTKIQSRADAVAVAAALGAAHGSGHVMVCVRGRARAFFYTAARAGAHSTLQRSLPQVEPL